MTLLERIISVVAPYDCLGCGREGRLLCTDCLVLFPDVPERCYRCHKASPGGLTCASCRSSSRLHRVRVATDYEGVAKDIVWRIKFDGAQSVTKDLAACLANLLPREQEFYLVPVPTTTGRARQRSYDQAKLLARALSRQTGHPYRDYLARIGKTHQIGSSRQERLRQLSGCFRVKSFNSVRGRRLILIDDVVTTGATLEAAATALRQAGAKRVEAVVFAQP